MTENESASYLERVFAKDLNGHILLSNKSQWINFLLVKNRNWYFDNVVLLGDALHTAHFSIGSGTKLALEDAIALYEAILEHPNIQEALALFESRRKPIIDEYQLAAQESLLWFERARDHMHLAPLSFAYNLMMRSKRIDHENLRKRDPEFVARFEEANARLTE
jgi:anthraniloyl-CoA monooxygenase